MTRSSPTIAKDPVRPASLDFFHLRREAIECIGELGSQQWTDYNTHDPGITLLESLLFTITDLAHRSRWKIADLLVNARKQAFYTAREILTVDPVTPDDYRRLLIDVEKVRNAWVVCKSCACGEGTARVQGLYDIRLELESDSTVGDLNDRVITKTLQFIAGSELHQVIVEVRFPRIELADRKQFEALMAVASTSPSIECIRFMRANSGEAPSNTILGDDELRRAWRNVFYATLLVGSPSGPITVPDVSIRFFASTAGKNALGVSDLVGLLEENGASGVLPLYLEKQRLAQNIVDAAKARYHAHRNLDEDLCRLSVVDVGQVAVCAEIEVAPDADIELIQARVWFAIEKYLAPSIPFYGLTELRNEGVAVEQIFDGPALQNGFIKQADLDRAQLRGVVRASDIINSLMDIEGVQSIGSLLMTRYDDEGNAVKGAADPTFDGEGAPVFDTHKVSASWLLYMAQGQQPRLYHNLSNLKFRKNGLPLTVDQDEAYDTLTQLRGEDERPKQPGGKNDLATPSGSARNAADITPVQYLLPLVYGVSAEGLPTHAGSERQDQALQLKAYLMVFEQLLGNAFEQVARFPELFSTDPHIAATYFAHDFSGQIARYGEFVEGLDGTKLQGLCESAPEFLERRNLFLDHLMARFGLNFADYALLLTNWKGESVGRRDLIADKLAVLAAYPLISGARARAFDHRHEPLLPSNVTVLRQRIALLLGYADLRFDWVCDESDPNDVKTTGFTLVDGHGEVWARGSPTFSGASVAAATRAATNALLKQLGRSSAYGLRAIEGGYQLVVRDESSVEIAEVPAAFASVSLADEFRSELIATSSAARSLIVEHLLLRPKFPGDAVYRECGDCEDADPWSFRLTVVMPGWTEPYNVDLDWRDFANRTIQEEIPSHLLAKVCWVGDEGHAADLCDSIVRTLTRIVEQGAVTEEGSRPTCEQALACAVAAYQAHERTFADWYAGKEYRSYARDVAPTILAELFAALEPAGLDCELDLARLWESIQNALVAHFANVMLHGYQFTRFEQAWYAWLEEDVRFDWGEERLADRVHAMLKSRLEGTTTTDLCACAKGMLEGYGQAFSAWMAENLGRGRELGEFTPFAPPPIELCDGAEFLAGTGEAIAEFLEERYADYVVVSYRLSLLVRLLESLTNTYPAATLHDCDDGSDENPVRLNQTALGSLSTGASERADLIVETEPSPRKRSAKRRGKRKR